MKTKIANAAGKALQIELELFSNLVLKVLEHAQHISRTADAIAVLDVAQGLSHLAENP